MTCPRGDGELIARSATGLEGIPLSYHLCLACLGHWTRPFDANYLPLSALPQSKPQEEPSSSFRCPECQEPLERAHEDAMAPDVRAWYCPTGHGYFFPRGNLRKFRQAQEARLSYHKLWQIPTPPLRNILLVSVLLFLFVSGGILISEVQKRQTLVSQAQNIIVYHGALVDRSIRATTIIARTSQAVTLAVTITPLGVDAWMDSSDGLTHTLTVPDLQSGSYAYTFHYLKENIDIASETYTFEVK